MKTTEQFMAELPRTPISQHIAQIHSILLHLYGQTSGHGVDAVEMAEHSLRQIAISGLSMMDPETAYREQMRWQRRGRVPDPPPANFAPNMQAAVREAFANMSEVVKRIRLPTLSPEAKEARAAREYKRMIAAERAKARAHLKTEVTRVRRELGLTETGEQ